MHSLVLTKCQVKELAEAMITFIERTMPMLTECKPNLCHATSSLSPGSLQSSKKRKYKKRMPEAGVEPASLLTMLVKAPAGHLTRVPATGEIHPGD